MIKAAWTNPRGQSGFQRRHDSYRRLDSKVDDSVTEHSVFPAAGNPPKIAMGLVVQAGFSCVQGNSRAPPEGTASTTRQNAGPVRVSELSKMQVADVDLEACKIRINQGKGSEDRYVLFGKSFAHGSAGAHRCPFKQSLAMPDQAGDEVQHLPSSAIVKHHAEAAGLRGTTHI